MLSLAANINKVNTCIEGLDIAPEVAIIKRPGIFCLPNWLNLTMAWRESLMENILPN